VGAWASEQSRTIATRSQLIEQWRAASRRFGTPPVGPDAREADRCTVTVPRPPHWGAVRFWIDSVELWVEGDFRIHDRARWTRELSPTTSDAVCHASAWQSERLQP
jgi:pyridoxamine 5'-phosphate oxidase